MNLLNIFKKQKSNIPNWKTTYPPNKSSVDYEKRITTKKGVYDNSTKITGIVHTAIPNNRPDINDWAKEVGFSSQYDKVQCERFQQRLIENGDVINTIKEYQRKNGIQPFKISKSQKIINFLNRHF